MSVGSGSADVVEPPSSTVENEPPVVTPAPEFNAEENGQLASFGCCKNHHQGGKISGGYRCRGSSHCHGRCRAQVVTTFSRTQTCSSSPPCSCQ